MRPRHNHGVNKGDYMSKLTKTEDDLYDRISELECRLGNARLAETGCWCDECRRECAAAVRDVWRYLNTPRGRKSAIRWQLQDEVDAVLTLCACHRAEWAGAFGACLGPTFLRRAWNRLMNSKFMKIIVHDNCDDNVEYLAAMLLAAMHTGQMNHHNQVDLKPYYDLAKQLLGRSAEEAELTLAVTMPPYEP